MTSAAGKIWARTKSNYPSLLRGLQYVAMRRIVCREDGLWHRAYDVFRLEDGAWVWCGRRDLLDGHNRFQNSF